MGEEGAEVFFDKSGTEEAAGTPSPSPKGSSSSSVKDVRKDMVLMHVITEVKGRKGHWSGLDDLRLWAWLFKNWKFFPCLF